jgi:DNA-3-methyladenine glycosylase II
VSSIVAQMISTQAARTVHGRLVALLESDPPTPAAVLAAGSERLRGAGLSRTKAGAITTLAEHVRSGELDLEALCRRPSAEVTRALVALPGLGPWTANMFLMFQLGRPDVFPAKDVGVQEGMRRAYALVDRPTAREAAARAEAWAPYRSTAAWYLWRALDADA